MQSPLKLTIKVRKDQNGINGSTSCVLQDSKKIEQTEVKMEQTDLNGSTSASNDDKKTEESDLTVQEHGNDSSRDEDGDRINTETQLVLYDPAVAGAVVPVPDPGEYRPPPIPGFHPHYQRSGILPSVGAFTVQCANCFKWRLIPTKEKYEEIREHILDQPFLCDAAREWRATISCEDPPDIEQDGSRLWAIDKPNIAQPPPGWERLLRIRAEGGSKFADVYYVAPTGKRLRSMVEVQKYLMEHPQYLDEGVKLSQFSFQIPRPLQEDYVRKRPMRVAGQDGSFMRLPGSLEPSAANPISWAGPEENTDLQLGMPGLSNSYFDENRTPKKARKAMKKQSCSFDLVYND